MWDDPKAMNTVALALVACSLAMFVTLAIAWASRQPVFAIHRVVVRGELKQVNPAHLEAVAREALRGTFFTLNLDLARAAFVRVPWVRTASVRRLWPDQLEVSLAEHVPLARWNDAALVDTQGEVFQADYAGELPAFSGPEGTAGEMSAHYREFGDALRGVGLSLASVRLSGRHGWELKLDNNLALALGRDDPAQRLARFVAFYPATIARVTSPVDYVDMRYRNGFAARVTQYTERHEGPARKNTKRKA
jgi:cell division protein FtsQ